MPAADNSLPPSNLVVKVVQQIVLLVSPDAIAEVLPQHITKCLDLGPLEQHRLHSDAVRSMDALLLPAILAAQAYLR